MLQNYFKFSIFNYYKNLYFLLSNNIYIYKNIHLIIWFPKIRKTVFFLRIIGFMIFNKNRYSLLNQIIKIQSYINTTCLYLICFVQTPILKIII